MLIKFLLLTAAISSLTACGKTDNTLSNNSENRWYSEGQVIQGAATFVANCSTCHGDKAQGIVANWKQALPDGKYPAPPLNGSAHAWHHPKVQLLRSINEGGILLGGTMPSFKNKLTEEEKLSAIAYFQSFWSQQTYEAWEKQDRRLSQ